MLFNRSFKHINIRYIYNRIKLIIYEKRFPKEPWLTAASNQILNNLLNSNDVGIEFGSGRSTIWFSVRVKKLYSLETNVSWFKLVKKNIDSQDIKNIKLLLIDENDPNFYKNYTEHLNKNFSDKFNFVLIDGKLRGKIALQSINKVKSGGLIIVDNINRYLGSSSYSPNSRSIQDGPIDKDWEEFKLLTKNWRYIWTTNGVTDTAIYFHP